MTQILIGSQWDTFTAARHRKSSNGLAMMPVASAYPQAAVVVGLNGGIEYDEIMFIASRKGEPPIVPAPWTTNKNRVFLSGEQSAAFPMPEINGVKTYGICGMYVWGILAPEGLESDFMIGTVPFPGLDSNEYIPRAYFSYTMMNQRLTQIVDKEPVPTLPQAIQDILNLQRQIRG